MLARSLSQRLKLLWRTQVRIEQDRVLAAVADPDVRGQLAAGRAERAQELENAHVGMRIAPRVGQEDLVRRDLLPVLRDCV